ncbi:MAG TPA: hypothetical protein VH988_23100 [Thermoanaerobaculia bacterium]|nr:hypothetical protein [Thermoanaerobaculia bacterium]
MITKLCPAVLLALFLAASSVAAVQHTSIGPEGGAVTVLAVDPGSAATVYAGTGAGIYRSVDHGQSWTAASRGMTNVAITALVVEAHDPVTPRALLAGTAGGLFRSTDGAGTWEPVPLTAGSSDDIQSLTVDAADPRTLYAGIDPSSPADHLVRSTDGGTSWEVVPFPGERPLALAANGPLVLAGTFSGLYQSTDGGASWDAVPAVSGAVRTLFLRGLLILAGTQNGIFRSLDGGATWDSSSQGIPNPQTAQVTALATDPIHPWVFYAGISRFGGSDVFKSADRGGHWRPVSMGLAQRGVLALAVDPATGATVYAGTQVDGVFRSLDASSSWRAANHGLRAAAVLSVAVDPTRPRRLYAVTVNGIFRSGDGGSTWTRLRSDPWGNVAVDPAGVVYALTGTLGLARSRDAGVIWTSIDPGLVGRVTFALDPAHPDVLFAGGHWALARSRNAGAAWSNEAMGCMDAESLDVVAKTGEVYVAGFPSCQFQGGGVRRSLDGGVTWTDVSSNLPPPRFIQTFAADPRTPAHLFAGGWPSGATFRGAGFRSTDRGASWLRLNGPGGGAIGIGAFAFPSGAPNTVYAGADGVWVSTDGGATWSHLDPLAGRLVNGLALDPTAPGALYAATEGGLFRISAD